MRLQRLRLHHGSLAFRLLTTSFGRSNACTNVARIAMFVLLRPAFHLVIDIDDTRRIQYRAYYTQRKPLMLADVAERL